MVNFDEFVPRISKQKRKAAVKTNEKHQITRDLEVVSMFKRNFHPIYKKSLLT